MTTENITQQEIFDAMARRRQFEEWKQDKRELEITKRISAECPAYAPSPDEVLDAEKRRMFLSSIFEYLEKQIKNDDLRIFYRYSVCQETIEDIMVEYHLTKRTAYRIISKTRKQLRKILKPKVKDLMDTSLVASQGKPYVGSTPSFQYEYERNRCGKKYRYKNSIKFHNKCMLPEYFKQSFHDNCTKCSLCTNNHGASTCSRKDFN